MKLTVAQLVKEFPPPEEPAGYHFVNKSTTLNPGQSQKKPIHNATPYFFKIGRVQSSVM
jgi:hypothetical protein